jgi:hypothetical protein
VLGRDAPDVPGAWGAMVASIRNVGRPGVASMAISAVDTALRDLKARLLGLSVARLLGTVREAAPVYGSGGFTTYSDERLREQFGTWVHDPGIPRVKMKIGEGWGTNEARDLERVHAARETIGADAQLFVDAKNGAYTRKQAVRMARAMADDGVAYLEEPVSSDDLEGLRRIRNMVDMDVAAGEYGYHLAYFADMCAAEAVDILQADVSRCGGITEWMRVAAVAAAHGLRVSADTAQSLARRLRGLERRSPGVLPRPRAMRSDPVRRRPRSGRRGAASGSRPSGVRARAEGRRRRAIRRLAPDRRQDLDAVAERVRRVKALEPLELRVVDDVEAGRPERGAPGLEVVDEERGMRRASRRERLLHAEMHLEATA